jgi:Holliday junction resolvase
MTPEAKVKKKCTDLLKKYKAYYFMPPANGYGRAGIPDIVGCYNGKFFGVECKAGVNTTTPLQNRELEAIVFAGGAAFVIREDNLVLLEHWLQKWRFI